MRIYCARSPTACAATADPLVGRGAMVAGPASGLSRRARGLAGLPSHVGAATGRQQATVEYFLQYVVAPHRDLQRLRRNKQADFGTSPTSQRRPMSYGVDSSK